MNILVYTLPGLNEKFYIDYTVKGLRALDHNVTYLAELPSQYINRYNDPLELDKFDLIIYSGFSFGNMTMHQNLNYSPALKTKTKVVVMYYDNPFRYMNVLYHHFTEKTSFSITCCDNYIVQSLRRLGMNANWSPVCFDPDIQRRGDIDTRFTHDIAFAGTVLAPEKLQNMMNGKSFKELSVLQNMLKARNKDTFFNYSEYLLHHFNITDKVIGELSFVNLMQQKYLLRMAMFESIANNKLKVHKYGQGDWESDHPSIITHGNLNQHTELPALYRSAKVNLSIELLPSSTHQRIMEIGGCGGFCLLESKADNYLNFSKDLVDELSYETFDEMVLKLKYFLDEDHEQERQSLARTFHAECLAKHTCVKRMVQLLGEI